MTRERLFAEAVGILLVAGVAIFAGLVVYLSVQAVTS